MREGMDSMMLNENCPCKKTNVNVMVNVTNVENITQSLKDRGRVKFLKRCESSDLDFNKITEFYKYVINNTKGMSECGRWIYGQHPTDEMIKSYIDSDSMYYMEEDGNIIAAVAVTFCQGEDYHGVHWSKNFHDDEVAVVHILCVDPKKQKGGLAKEVMAEIVNMAKVNNKKAVRLDALCCNTPAHRLYESIGFKKCDVQNWYASNTGWIDFYMYEYDF